MKLMVLINEYVSAIFSGAEGGLDSVRIVVELVFCIKVWSLDLCGWFATVRLFWLWLT